MKDAAVQDEWWRNEDMGMGFVLGFSVAISVATALVVQRLVLVFGTCEKQMGYTAF